MSCDFWQGSSGRKMGRYLLRKCQNAGESDNGVKLFLNYYYRFKFLMRYAVSGITYKVVTIKSVIWVSIAPLITF